MTRPPRALPNLLAHWDAVASRLKRAERKRRTDVPSIPETY
jgi:hypothetical protein